MSEGSMEYGDKINRRRFVQLTGVSGAAALAGCAGGGDGGDQTTTETDTTNSDDSKTTKDDSDEGGVTVHDTALDDISFLVPKNIQFNTFNPNKYSQMAYYFLFDKFAQFNFATGEFTNYAISDWSFSDKKATLKIREGLTWYNGDPVTARDIKTQLLLQKHIGGTLWQYAESVSTEGDRTVVITLKEKTNPIIMKHTLAVTWVQAPHSKYGKFLKAIQEADSEKAKNKAIANLTEYAPKDPLGNGVFKKQSADKQQATYVRNPDHPDANNVNYKKYRQNYTGGNQSSWQALLSGSVDAAYSLFTPPRIVANLPDEWVEAKMPAQWGYGLTPNLNTSPLDKRAMRQGIMYVLNREQIVKNAGPRTKVTPQIPTAISAGEQERYLGDEMSTYDSYGPGKEMKSKAEQKFKEAGLTKEGGTWKDSDGNPVKLPVLVPSGWSDWVTAAQTITDQLSSFGFKSSIVSKDFGTVLSDWANGNFTLASFYWLPGGARSSFPYFPISHQLTPKYSGTSGSITWGYENKKKATVPSRTGSGEQTVELKPSVTSLAQATEKKQETKLIRELAWVANQDLPMLPIAEKQNQSWLSEKEWDVPKEGSDKLKVQWPQSWLTRQGDLQYSGK